MIHSALSWLNPNPEESVLDLFCGIGNFTLPLATKAKEVIGIEGIDNMVKRARQNAQLNQIKNTEFYTADLNAPLSHFPKLSRRFDCILLDPPRSGALEIIKQHFKDWNAKRIVYISCDPATLARDTAVLVHELGYRLEKIRILDMFPQTRHVESMALLTRQE